MRLVCSKSGAVIGEESLRDTVSDDALLDDGDGALGGFTPGDVGRDCEPGVVIDELKDLPGPPFFGPFLVSAFDNESGME